eukprot:COSAG05_NODE_1758_length_4138_cov_1092.842783_3_plen_136_part_00
MGTLNVTSTTGDIKVGVVTRGLIGVQSQSGAIELTVPNSFAGSYDLRCSSGDLSISVSQNSRGIAFVPCKLHFTLITGFNTHHGAVTRLQGAEGTVISYGLREKGALTGTIGHYPGGASLVIRSDSGDVTVKVVM